MISFDANTILALIPPAGVALLALILVLVDIFWPARDRLVVVVAVGGLAILMALTVVVGPLPGIGLLTGAQEVFGGAYVADPLTALLDLTLMAIALMTILFGPDYLRPRGLPAAEFAAMLLFAVTGGMLISGARDLLLLFLAL